MPNKTDLDMHFLNKKSPIDLFILSIKMENISLTIRSQKSIDYVYWDVRYVLNLSHYQIPQM